MKELQELNAFRLERLERGAVRGTICYDTVQNHLAKQAESTLLKEFNRIKASKSPVDGLLFSHYYDAVLQKKYNKVKESRRTSEFSTMKYRY
jgi:hypothetical protein